MASNIRRFISKAERIATAKAAEARQAVLDLGLPETATEDILITIQRHETGGQLAKWSFNMISPQQCLVVWNAIDALPSQARPREVRRIFDYVLTHIETNTGLVTLTRDELAQLTDIEARHVSSAMKQLEALNVVRRERVKVPGMRGPGKARYRLNPHVGWNGELEKREALAADDQPPLPFELIDGGRT